MDYGKLSLELCEKNRGKLEMVSKVPVTTMEELSTAYTPGVAEPCRKIAADKQDVYKYTTKGNTVAVVTDGSAVLGLGDIGPEAALPVMEGKAVLFKEFGGVDQFRSVLIRRTPDNKTVKYIARHSAVSTWRIFLLQDVLKSRRVEAGARYWVFRDDQHGTAIVVA